MDNFKYGALLTTVSAAGEDDTQSIHAFLDSAAVAEEVGCDAIWITEHHFSAYHPAPNPMTLLAAVAARCPRLGLGTSVLVTPWHHPLRLAGDIATLSNLTDAPIYIGMGRGNAPMEYEAFGVPMEEAIDRFADCWGILRTAFEGKPFTYQGKQLSVEREVAIFPRPRSGNVHFYGAVGQPASATRIGQQGLALMVNANASMQVQGEILANWKAEAGKLIDTTRDPKVASPWMIIADTDQEAEELALKYLAAQLNLSAAHYKLDAERHKNIRGYEHMIDRRAAEAATPELERVRSFMRHSFVGSPETVARKMIDLLETGYDYILVNPSMPDSPHELRRTWLRRFVSDVLPLVRAQRRQAA